MSDQRPKHESVTFTLPRYRKFCPTPALNVSASVASTAKQAASALVFGRDVVLQTHGQDKYGRTLADVVLRDGTNVNHELVKNGWCWWYRKYASSNFELESLEKDARDAKKGLWADPQPVPPWEWRRAGH
jgi:micrococcal nuclease